MFNGRITNLVETEYIPHVLQKLSLFIHQQFTYTFITEEKEYSFIKSLTERNETH